MILVVNAGSTSIKAEVFDADLASLASGMVDGIGGRARLRIGETLDESYAPDHDSALEVLLDGLSGAGFPLGVMSGAGHRVVHGGARLTRPVRVTDETIAEIEACVPLAPLHNPANLAAIRALAAAAPDLPQTASFDTAFHADNDDLATTYALPESLRREGMRRYGFHGLSYASLVESMGDRLPERLIAFHLGGGSSIAAIREGRSVATTMGYSPLSGPPMGTRSGDIDAAIVLEIAGRRGVEDTLRFLNRDSGIRGLAGTADMRELEARGDPAAEFAIEHFAYWCARHAGSLTVALGGVDALAFTGGIGENSARVRDAIVGRMAFLGEPPVHVVPADEERQIARDALRLLG